MLGKNCILFSTLRDPQAISTSCAICTLSERFWSCTRFSYSPYIESPLSMSGKYNRKGGTYRLMLTAGKRYTHTSSRQAQSLLEF